jgi:hypothetical protein
MSEGKSPCGACQNMDAYWEERARKDPAVRARLLRLERQKEPWREEDRSEERGDGSDEDG